MSPLEIAAAAGIVGVGAALQGAVGFGYAIVAAPLLLLIDPRLVPGPLVFAALVLVVLTVLRDWRGADLTGVGWILVGRLPGTAAGAAVLSAIPASLLPLPLGALVLVAVGVSASGLRVRPTRGALVSAGAASGLMGTITSIGGPPLALVYQDSPGAQLRGTLAGNFAIGALFSLTALFLVGRFGEIELSLALVLIPGTLLGFAVSGHLARILDGGYTRPAVLTVSAVAALSVIARQLF